MELRKRKAAVAVEHPLGDAVQVAEDILYLQNKVFDFYDALTDRRELVTPDNKDSLVNKYKNMIQMQHISAFVVTNWTHTDDPALSFQYIVTMKVKEPKQAEQHRFAILDTLDFTCDFYFHADFFDNIDVYYCTDLFCPCLKQPIVAFFESTAHMKQLAGDTRQKNTRVPSDADIKQQMTQFCSNDGCDSSVHLSCKEMYGIKTDIVDDTGYTEWYCSIGCQMEHAKIEQRKKQKVNPGPQCCPRDPACTKEARHRGNCKVEGGATGKAPICFERCSRSTMCSKLNRHPGKCNTRNNFGYN